MKLERFLVQFICFQLLSIVLTLGVNDLEAEVVVQVRKFPKDTVFFLSLTDAGRDLQI